MGLFTRSHNNGSRVNAETKTEVSKPSKYDVAMEYFDGEEIRCRSPRDRRTIEKLYSALKEDNYDTADDSSLVSALSSLDANVYNLCHALINQNFMLMRKVDDLSDRLQALEDKLR